MSVPHHIMYINQGVVCLLKYMVCGLID